MTPPPPATERALWARFRCGRGKRQVTGTSSPALRMPYLNGLANQYGLATNYFANAHPSIPNYFELTTGQILTLDRRLRHRSRFPRLRQRTPSVSSSPTANPGNLTLRIFPAVGYTGGDSGNYAVRHNPAAYMTDVQNDPAQTTNLVPFSQLAADVRDGANLPEYSFIVPNLCNDAHDCALLTTADDWLKSNLRPSSFRAPRFQKDGLLLIIFDEGGPTDLSAGGGHVAAVIVSPFAKHGYKSVALYQHQSVLRLMLEGLGVTKLPGDAATAPPMWEFFNTRRKSSQLCFSLRKPLRQIFELKNPLESIS